MTARQHLERVLGPYFVNKGLVEAALAEYAHELAEKQRWIIYYPEDWHPRFVSGVRHAADLIDPEVTS